MRLLIALILPWLTFFTIGRPIAGIICLLLQITLIGWLPAAIWAEPGITRVMPRKISPRRSMTRSARRMAVPGRGGSDSLAIGADETSSRTSSAVLFDT